MSRSNEALKLKSEIDLLQQQLDAISEENSSWEDRFRKCKRAVEQIPSLKRKGMVLIIIGILLIPVELILLMNGGNFSFLDIVIIAIPLIWGLVRRKNAQDEINTLMGDDKSFAQLQQELAELEAQKPKTADGLDAIDLEMEISDKQADLDKLVAYTGKAWDVANTAMTPQNVKQLEKDMVEMLCHLAFAEDGTENFLTECWLFQGFSATAEMCGNQAEIEKCKRFKDNLSDSGSWILKIFNFAQWLYSLEMVQGMLEAVGGTSKQHMVLAELLTQRNYRRAETELEDEFIQILPLAFARVGGIVHMGDMDQFRMKS